MDGITAATVVLVVLLGLSFMAVIVDLGRLR